LGNVFRTQFSSGASKRKQGQVRTLPSSLAGTLPQQNSDLSGRPLSYEAMADDMAALLKYLSTKQADIMLMGFRLAGGGCITTSLFRQSGDGSQGFVVVSPLIIKRDWWLVP